MPVSEKAYTKSDIMQALSFIKTPDPEEREHIEKEGKPSDYSFNDMADFQIGFVGAECLIQVLFDGLDASEARNLFKSELVKAILRGAAQSLLRNL